jgi:glycerophosphoryl diester phosphodiesterase
VLDLFRTSERPLRIGHRGAAALAPENTLSAFRRAIDHGVDLIEFDVIDLRDGPLVVAHSDRLEEVSHGAARGRVRDRTLAELREIAPDLPTFDDALAFFVDEAPTVGLHVDLKLSRRLDELAAAIERHGVASRTVVSSHHVPSLRAVARGSRATTIGLTYPEDKLGISRKPYLWPVARAGLDVMRAAAPARVSTLLRRADARALMLQHRLVTPRVVEAAHRSGAPVLAWTVDHAADLARVVAAGVDGVITNDPRIFSAVAPGAARDARAAPGTLSA